MIRRRAAYLFSLTLLTTAAVAQQDPSPLGESGDWAAYTYKTPQGGKVCYILSQPKVSEPKAVKRDPIFFIVTHRPSQDIRNEVSTMIGYAFKRDATVEVKVDEAAYDLFSNGDVAWADTKDKDRKIVASMKKGKALSVKGTSVRGTSTIDSYSLKGFTLAMTKIDGACK